MIDVAQNYSFGLPVAASTYAGRLDTSLHVLQAGMLVIFVVWFAFFVYVLVRFRRSRQPAASYHGWTGHAASFVPDVVVLTFELWLIFFFGLPIWSHVKEEMPDPAAANVVELSAEQFAWGFQYAGPDGAFGKRDPLQISVSNPLGLDAADPASADDIVVFNELHVPLGKPTLLYMTSKDVIHSFFVPEFRVKQDVVPGLRTPLWFEPVKAGRYEIGCAQLCGTGHYVMRGDVVVETPEEYEAWLASKRKA
jgi:cytochrome c oxidase subunit 2